MEAELAYSRCLPEVTAVVLEDGMQRNSCQRRLYSGAVDIGGGRNCNGAQTLLPRVVKSAGLSAEWGESRRGDYFSVNSVDACVRRRWAGVR